jgi:hypothetical protein
MPTVTLTAREYNELQLRTALATAAARNGNPGACRGIPGRDNPAPETRINTGDSIRVSVTGNWPPPGAAAGRPRLYATPPESNRLRQRAYRQRQRSRNTRLGIEGRTQ